MIERHWKGLAKKENKDKYIVYLTQQTFSKLQGIDGFLGSKILTNDREEGVEFLIITLWESLDHIKSFAGEQINTAVVPQDVEEMMIDYELHVTHYEVED